LTPGQQAELRSRARFGWVLAAIALAGLVLRVLYVELVDVRLGADAIWYALQAGTIKGGHGYVDPAAFYSGRGAIATANFPPLWPATLALVGKLGPDGTHDYRLVGSVLGAGTVALTGWTGRRVAGDTAALGAAAVVALSPLAIAADGSLMAETLFTLLVTAAVLASYLVIERPDARRFALLGLLLGAAALTRGDGLVVAPVLVAVTAWRARPASGRRLAIGVLTAVVVLGAVLVQWGVRSSERLGTVVVVATNGGSLLEGANCGPAYGGEGIGSWEPRCLRETRRAGRTEAEWSRAATRAGLDYARDHAGRLAALVVPARVLRGWGVWEPTAGARSEAVESRRYGWQLLGWGAGLALLAAAALGARELLRRRVEIGPLLAVVGAVTLVLAGSWGNSRFRVVADPALAILASGLVVRVLSARRGRARPGGPPSPDPRPS
jgi:4-amino-4-deoxy-L-arabinose transferase-like glycosyltransferase